jgi:hypothetical protein
LGLSVFSFLFPFFLSIADVSPLLVLQHALTPPPSALREGEPPPPVTSVAISRCGNFGIVGSASGAVHRYNLQSGRHRGARPTSQPQHETQTCAEYRHRV